MAKQRGPFGTGFVGKLGNTIGRKGMKSGEYIASAYQPQVNQPNSDAQIVRRSGFALLTRLGGVLGRDNLIGMRATARANGRNHVSQFVSTNYPYVDFETGTTEAKLEWQNVILSLGGASQPQSNQVILVPDPDDPTKVASATVNVTLPASSNARRVTFVCVLSSIADPATRPIVLSNSVNATMQPTTPQNVSTTFVFNMGADFPYDGWAAHLYAFVREVVTGAVSSSVDPSAYNDASINVDASTGTGSSFDYSRSTFLGNFTLAI